MRSLLFLLSFLMVSQTSAAVVIVVNKTSPIEALHRDEVANIFLARTKRLPNGVKASPLELNDVDEKTWFYEQISGKTTRQLNAYWASLVFTGKGRPPKALDDVAQLEQRLASQPGAIAYVPAELVSNNMRVVFEFDDK